MNRLCFGNVIFFLCLHAGKAGKEFVAEVARLYNAYADASPLECIALKSVSVMQALLLQKPYAKSKSKDHMLHLSRRLSLWKNGRSIQKRFVNTGRKQDDEQTARIFSKLMMEEKALRFVSDISN